MWAWLGALACAAALWLGAGHAGRRARGAHVRRACALVAWIGLVLVSAAAGGSAALLRAESVRAPVVKDTLRLVEIVGRVGRVDRSQSGRWRIVLDVGSIDGTETGLPRRVRISLAGAAPAPGQRVRCRATLRPPPGPVAPGAYDFSRRAWFLGLGAVGYASGPCEPLTDGMQQAWPDRVASVLANARMDAARHIAAAAPGSGGALMAALATGDRSALAEADVEAMQTAGVSHIVSVSGLHVGLVSGLVFLALWRGLALVPGLALRIDTRKPAAAAGLLAAFAYTVFSGAEAPAVRACVMAAVAFGAIIFDRKAVTMRGLALAAFLVLSVRPESAVEPGFQMSFLATAALVALWEVWGERPRDEAPPGLFAPLAKAGAWLGAAAGASLVAGLATAPIAASTFHRLAPYGLPANLAAAPVTDFWVGPLAVLAAAVSPLGLDAPVWSLASKGLDAVLWIAHTAAGLPGAEAVAPWTGPAAPATVIAGVLWLCLWRSMLRWLGIGMVGVGLALWAVSPRPVGFVAPGGMAVLMVSPDAGSALCWTKGARFDAVRLVDAAPLSGSARLALAPVAGRGARPECALGEGDWQARYLPAERGPAVLALGMDGRTHGFGPGDLPGGALVTRDGWRVRLVIPPRLRAPWSDTSAAGGAGGDASAVDLGTGR